MREKLKAFVEKWRTSAKTASGVEECALCLSAEIEIHSILSESQWVPVTERLPDTPRTVLVTDIEQDGIVTGYYVEGTGWVSDDGAVTHWHEIDYPEPPEKQL